MCFKKSSSRKKLKCLIKFLNENRIWKCGRNCIVAPECFYCQLIYQLNYSYIKNKDSDIETYKIAYFVMFLLIFKDCMKSIMEKRIG